MDMEYAQVYALKDFSWKIQQKLANLSAQLVMLSLPPDIALGNALAILKHTHIFLQKLVSINASPIF